MDRISETVASFLLNATWQITLIALVAWFCSHLLRNAAARYRHALWVAALVMSIALPLWGSLNFAGQAPEQMAALDSSPGAKLPASPATAKAALVTDTASAKESDLALGQLLQKRKQHVMTAPSLALGLSILYGLFILYRLGRLYWSWQHTRMLRHSVYELAIPGRIVAVAARCRAAFGIREVRLLCSWKTAAPVTVGATEPLIILPEAFCTDVQDETILSVVGHEMAHVARRDYSLNLIYQFLALPISFHPLLKLIKRQIGRTREMACDDLVTERLIEPKAYASALLRAASALVAPTGKAFTLGIFDADNLEERILKLTQKHVRTGERACRLLALTAFSLLCLSCLTISTFSFELRARDQFAGAGLNSVAFEGSSARPGGGGGAVAQSEEAPILNQSRSLTRNTRGPQPGGLESAEARAAQACEALRRRAVEAIPTLVSMLGDERPTELLRCWESSLWSPALSTFKQPSPGEQAAIALASMGQPALEPLTNALSASTASVRRNAAWAIGELTNMRGNERAISVQPLLTLLDDADEWVRMAAVRALGEIGDERAVEKLLAVLSDGGWKVRELAAWALGEMRDERAVETLCRVLLEDAEAKVRETSAWALGEINDPKAAPFLQQALNDAELLVRDKARWALSEIDDSDG